MLRNTKSSPYQTNGSLRPARGAAMKRIWLGILGALLLIGVSIWWIATHPPKDGPEYTPESLSRGLGDVFMRQHLAGDSRRPAPHWRVHLVDSNPPTKGRSGVSARESVGSALQGHGYCQSVWVPAMTKTLIARKGPMHSPSHPGEILQTMYLEPLGFSITRTARAFW